MIWLVTANTNYSRIFHYEKPKKLTLIKEFNHSESKLKDSELVADKPGHYNTSNSARGAYSPREAAKENEIRVFSKQLVKELDAGRKANNFNELILAIPPHMNGLIVQEMNDHLKGCIRNNIKKDYTRLSEREILESLISDLP